MLELLYIILAAILSFVIAANNSANSVGTLYGSGIASYRTAALYSGFFVLLGALLEGGKMEGAISGGIVYGILNFQMSLIVLLSTFLLMLIFTYFSMPLSASQIMVGSVVAVALWYNFSLHTTFLTLIFISWVLTFIAAMGVAYFLYMLLSFLTPKLRIFSLSRFYTISLFIGSAFIAYTLGANTIGLVASLKLSAGSLGLAGVAALLGTYFLGKKTVKTAGKKIVSLDAPRAFAAQISGAIVVELFTQFHMPVSITQAIIGGIIGTALLKGYREMHMKTLRNLAISWVLAPLLSFVFTFLLLTLSSWLL